MADSLGGDESQEAREAKAAVLDDLIAAALEHIEVHGRKLTLDDCYVYSCTQERGAYFPHVHWDTDYLAFPDVDAFQLWYLVANEKPTGNMFMASTPDLSSSDMPCRYLVQQDGGVVKAHHDTSDEECPIKSFSSLEDAGLRFRYLDMRPGDCVIMAKRTLHGSDPRPHLRGETVDRLAMNVRILIKPKGRRTFNIWTGHRYFSYIANMKSLLKHVQKDASGKYMKVNGYNQVLIPSRTYLTALQ
uniref:Uncharacterized protein n=1 Tax=Haptolina ericina TaxID=156174 RepID=A0A7S3B575_9EUKA